MKQEHGRRREAPRGGWLGATMRPFRTSVAVLPLFFAALPPAAVAAEAAPSVVERMDVLWRARPDIDVLRQMIDLGEEAERQRPDFEVAWRISRACVFLGTIQENRTLRKALAVKGMQWASKAQEMAPQRIEGHYYYGSTVGQYATTVGIITAVAQGIAGKFEASMNKSYQIDRDYDGGGSMIALGRFYYVLPWPKRDLDRSRQLLEEARRRHPERLLSRLYLADTYYDLGKKNEARSELRHVLASDVPADEQPMPFHDLARQRLQELFASPS